MGATQQSLAKVVRIAVMLLLVVVLLPLLPLLITRDWSWWQAWTYAALASLGFVLSRVVVARRHPDLLRERADTFTHADVKSWDQWLAPAMAFGGLVPPVIAAVERLWRPLEFGVPVNLTGAALILIGYLLGSVAMGHNRFFSGQVRIQTDRGHQVVSSGPYGWIRHPGYLGTLLAGLGMPLLLDSAWAWVGVAVIAVVTVVRTSLEDRTLQRELPGYADYAKRTRHRLLPGIW